MLASLRARLKLLLVLLAFLLADLAYLLFIH
jgi:hypothetical protein